MMEVRGVLMSWETLVMSSVFIRSLFSWFWAATMATSARPFSSSANSRKQPTRYFSSTLLSRSPPRMRLAASSRVPKQLEPYITATRAATHHSTAAPSFLRRHASSSHTASTPPVTIHCQVSGSRESVRSQSFPTRRSRRPRKRSAVFAQLHSRVTKAPATLNTSLTIRRTKRHSSGRNRKSLCSSRPASFRHRPATVFQNQWPRPIFTWAAKAKQKHTKSTPAA